MDLEALKSTVEECEALVDEIKRVEACARQTTYEQRRLRQLSFGNGALRLRLGVLMMLGASIADCRIYIRKQFSASRARMVMEDEAYVDGLWLPHLANEQNMLMCAMWFTRQDQVKTVAHLGQFLHELRTWQWLLPQSAAGVGPCSSRLVQKMREFLPEDGLNEVAQNRLLRLQTNPDAAAAWMGRFRVRWRARFKKVSNRLPEDRVEQSKKV